MQVVPDNINITTGYHVFETPEDICINSQMYDKITMEPKPYSFFNINQCLNNKNLLLYECNILEYPDAMIAREPDYQYYIQDNQDPNLFYFITEVSSSDNNQYICKAQKIENSWQVLNFINPDAGYNCNSARIVGSTGNGYSTRCHYKLIGQTNEYIIVTQTVSNGPDSQNAGDNTGWTGGPWCRGNTSRWQSLSYISIRKSNMSTKILNVGGTFDYSVYILKEQADQIYVFENFSNYLCITRLDPNTNTRLQLYTVDRKIYTDYVANYAERQDVKRGIGISNIILFRDKYYVMTCNSAVNAYAFQVFTINFNSNSVSCVEVGIPAIDGISFHRGYTEHKDSHWLQIDLKNVNNTYIAITIHDKRNFYRKYDYFAQNAWGADWYRPNYGSLGYTVASAKGWHRHALLKWSSGTTFVSKGIITPEESNQHIYGVLYYDQYTPIFFMNKRIVGYRLNTSTDKYTKCFEVAGTFNTIGIDENKKFYTFDNSNVCHIYNDVTSYLLDAQFEKTSYNYANTNISSYVRIYSKNFLNNYIQTKVKVMIEGNCRFTENNKKEIITYTNASDTKDIPVTITAGGTMYCYIKEVD